MKKNLTDKKWKEFPFIKIFHIYGGYYNKKPKMSEAGNTPFLGATQTNNGITGFSSKNDIKNSTKEGNYDSKNTLTWKIFNKNCIVVTNNGSVGYAYYQPYSFTCSHDINILFLKKKKLNRHIAYFLIQAIEKQRESFEYARKRRPKRMKKSKLLLPIDAKGEPDRAFMESYMKELEQKILKNAVSYYENRIFKKISLSEIWEIAVLNWKKWSEFSFENVFEKIQRGKRLTKNKHIEGNTPYISSTSFTNGIDGFIENKHQVRIFSHCISLANSGSVGKAFFHNYQFIGSDHITTLKTPQFEREIYLFMLPLIERLTEKYSFNREINDTRLKREKLLLPVNEQGNIDFEFMKKFIQKAEQYQLLKVYWKFRTPSHTHTHTTWIKTRNTNY